MNRKMLSTRDLCYIGLSVAVIAVLAQIALPLPGGVPFSLQTFAVPLVAIVMGAKKGFIAAIVYILLGAVGVRVFAGFSGGLQTLVGPTGGYLLSFPFMALVVGLGADSGSKLKLAICLAAGSILNLSMGTLQLAFVNQLGLIQAFLAGMAPFIFIEVIKMNLAFQTGLRIRQTVNKIPVREAVG